MLRNFSFFLQTQDQPNPPCGLPTWPRHFEALSKRAKHEGRSTVWYEDDHVELFPVLCLDSKTSTNLPEQ